MQDIEKEATAKDNTSTAFSEMNSGFFNTTFPHRKSQTGQALPYYRLHLYNGNPNAKLQTFQRVAPKGKAQNVILLS